MAVATATAMDALEIGDFLAGQETGVLALGMSEDVYAVPVSFAYEATRPALYFRFGYGPDSQKRRFVEGHDQATFVVYDRTEAGWQSVLAEGHLEPVESSQLDSTVVEAVNQLRIPFIEMHRPPRGALEFAIHRFEIGKLSGVTEAANRW